MKPVIFGFAKKPKPTGPSRKGGSPAGPCKVLMRNGIPIASQKTCDRKAAESEANLQRKLRLNPAESPVTAAASTTGRAPQRRFRIPQRLRENKPVNNGERAGQGRPENSG